MILDVAVTHPVPILSSRTLSSNEASQPCNTANLYTSKKKTTNTLLIRDIGYRFIMGNFENYPEFVLASGSVFLARH
jgi:hypothetical protein